MMDRTTHPRIRSLLFTPGNNARKLERVFEFGADAVNLDLEDAVPYAEKAAARRIVAATLDAKVGKPGPLIVARINPPMMGQLEADLEAVVHPAVFAIQVTKMQAVDEVKRVDEVITRLEAKRGLNSGSIRLISSIDSPYLVLNMREYVASTRRFYCLVIGGADFAVSLGLRASTTMIESLWARSYGVLVSAAAGMARPLHPPCFNLDNDEAYESLIRAGKSLGFQGAIALHPRQVAVAHRVFAATPEEVKEAREIIATFEAQEAKGVGSMKMASGEFVDYAIVAWARDIVALADKEASGKKL